MSGNQRTDEVYRYGHWSWILGMALAGGLIWLMFTLADGFA